MSGKAHCIACGTKEVSGIFTCEGCSRTFCMKHANEHRRHLNDDLDEIIRQHQILTQTIGDNQQQTAVLFERIDRWEKDAFEKIHQVADKTRKDLQILAQNEKEQIKDKFTQVAKQLANAREQHEYLERDLHQWKILHEQLKHDLNNLSPTIILHEDHNRILIPHLNVFKESQTNILNEKLMSFSDVIQFDEQHHTAMHCGFQRTPAYVYGTQEYTAGQHEIRLFMSKKTSEFVLSFNIISKLMEVSSDCFQSEYCAYGWQSDDCINPSKYLSANQKNLVDLKGKTKFHLKLLIDCDKQMISYFNEKTKRSKDILVDLERCPFPWKLYFYLYDVGDTIRLLSSAQLS